MRELFNKKTQDLTVGESFKMTGVISIASIGILALMVGAAVIYEKVQDKKIELEEAKKEETEIDD